MNPLLGALGDVGYLLDTPGAYLRGAMAGRPGERSSGEDLLSSYGVDGGPVGGMAAELALDPMALGLGAWKGLGALSKLGPHADDVNPLLRILRDYGDESGAMRPFQEIGRRADPDFVNSVDWYHGTGTPGLTPAAIDPMATDPGGLYGRGLYMSAAPPAVEGYARTRAHQVTRRPDRWSAALRESVAAHEARVQAAAAEYKALRAGGRTDLPGELDWIGDRVGPRPGSVPLIYEANTAFGNILDLDDVADGEFLEGLGHYARGIEDVVDHRMSSPLNEWEMLMDHVADADEHVDYGTALMMMLPKRFKDLPRDMPDPLIRALREMGYDALTHTGGGRVGGGKLMHDVLIGLDPNDTVSQVGRAGQITRFDPHVADELLRRLGGPS